jgi:predicted GH43/DUF377 family glycosyl hydrolase
MLNACRLKLSARPSAVIEFAVIALTKLIAENDGTLKIYWSAADTAMCVGTASIVDLVQLCRNKPRTAL